MFIRYILIVMLLIIPSFGYCMTGHALGTVYDSCYSPHKAKQPSGKNEVWALKDKNQPSRMRTTTHNGKHFEYPDNYSPDGCLAKIHKLLTDPLNHMIFIDVFAFRSYVIANDLIEAADRGVRVMVAVDQSQAKSQAHFSHEHADKIQAPILDKLRSAGIPILLKKGHSNGISHNKTISVVQQFSKEMDSLFVGLYVTGSYNFTDNAETQNRENMVFINSPALVFNSINGMLDHEGKTQEFAESQNATNLLFGGIVFANPNVQTAPNSDYSCLDNDCLFVKVIPKLS